MPELIDLLHKLEAHYGPQLPNRPTDPFLFLVRWHCGYPVSDAELRAMRLKETAERIQKEFGGALSSALKRFSVPQARAALRKFPGIANAGADRIPLFGAYRRWPPSLRTVPMAQEVVAAEVVCKVRPVPPSLFVVETSRSASVQAVQTQVCGLSGGDVVHLFCGLNRSVPPVDEVIETANKR